MKVIVDENKIDDILIRGVEDIFVKKDLKEKLMSGKQLKIKLGFDPTGSKIHIGRAIVLRKLRDFQKLGHEIVFIVGVIKWWRLFLPRLWQFTGTHLRFNDGN